MTDTNKPAAAEGEAVIPSKAELLGEQPEEGTEGEAKAEAAPVEHEYSPEEDIARQSGWVPKDEWKGKPEDWRPAKEFNERGELFTRIKSQSKELLEMKNAVNMLVAQQSKQYLKGFDDAVAQLKRDRAAAVADGDLERVVRITDAIDEVKEKRQEADRIAQPKAPVGPSDTFREWHTKNDWYMKDKVLSEHAEDVGEIFKKRNPQSTEAEMLEYVARQVRKEYPNKFRKAPPSPDGDGRQSSGGKTVQSSNKYSEMESEMTDEQRAIMKTILRQTKMSKDEYFKQYAEVR